MLRKIVLLVYYGFARNLPYQPLPGYKIETEPLPPKGGRFNQRLKPPKVG